MKVDLKSLKSWVDKILSFGKKTESPPAKPSTETTPSPAPVDGAKVARLLIDFGRYSNPELFELFQGKQQLVSARQTQPDYYDENNTEHSVAAAVFVAKKFADSKTLKMVINGLGLNLAKTLGSLPDKDKEAALSVDNLTNSLDAGEINGVGKSLGQADTLAKWSDFFNIAAAKTLSETYAGFDNTAKAKFKELFLQKSVICFDVSRPVLGFNSPLGGFMDRYVRENLLKLSIESTANAHGKPPTIPTTGNSPTNGTGGKPGRNGR